MSKVFNMVGGGGGGPYASICVTGLSETDTVTAVHKKTVQMPNPEYIGLPDGYTQLEYIESTGTQYIDTGVMASASLRFESDFTPHNNIANPGFGSIFGARSDSYQYVLNTYPNTTGGSFHCGTASGPAQANPELTKDTRCQVSFMGTTFTSAKGTTTEITSASNVGLSLSLFARNINGTRDEYGKLTLYGLKLYENSQIVRDFIPAKRNSDSVIGLYDLVTNSFFENAGTGVFIEGGEVQQYIDGYVYGKTIIGKWTQIPNPAYVVPDGYTQLEYIQSTGTQCFDTGIKASSNVGVEIDYFDFVTNGTAENILFSGSNGSWYEQLGMNNQMGYGKTYAYYGYDGNTGLPIETACKYKLENGVLYKNGERVYSNNFNSFSYNYNIYLLAQNWAGTIRNNIKLKLKSFKMWENKILVRDFIPAKRNTDSAVGLYDIVNGVFYTNAGTGEFIAGAEVPQTLDSFLIKPIRDFGTWTVTATDGTNTATQDVLVDVITEYDIEMMYNKLYLYSDGDECEDVTGGWSKKSASDRPDASITKNNTNISWTIVNNALMRIATNNQIDLTNYTKLVFQCAQTVSGTVRGTAFIQGACSNPTSQTVTMGNEGTVAHKNPMLNGSYEMTNVEVDISEISGSYYPYVRIDVTPGDSLTVNGVLYKVWLE